MPARTNRYGAFIALEDFHNRLDDLYQHFMDVGYHEVDHGGINWRGPFIPHEVSMCWTPNNEAPGLKRDVHGRWVLHRFNCRLTLQFIVVLYHRRHSEVLEMQNVLGVNVHRHDVPINRIIWNLVREEITHFCHGARHGCVNPGHMKLEAKLNNISRSNLNCFTFMMCSNCNVRIYHCIHSPRCTRVIVRPCCSNCHPLWNNMAPHLDDGEELLI